MLSLEGSTARHVVSEGGREMKWIGETVPVGVRTLGCVGLFNGREYLFKMASNWS